MSHEPREIDYSRTPYDKSVGRHVDKAVKKLHKEKALTKAKGGLIDKLKRTINDKGLKRDHYADFKKQHKMN